MKIAYNYTSIKNREKRIYSFAGTKISSSGLSTSFLTLAAVLLVLFNIVGAIICIKNGVFYYNPIRDMQNVKLGFPIIFIGAPIGLAALLNNAKIQNYKLMDYIYIYIKPKHCLDQNGKIIKHSKMKTDALVERIF